MAPPRGHLELHGCLAPPHFGAAELPSLRICVALYILKLYSVLGVHYGPADVLSLRIWLALCFLQCL